MFPAAGSSVQSFHSSFFLSLCCGAPGVIPLNQEFERESNYKTRNPFAHAIMRCPVRAHLLILLLTNEGHISGITRQ